MMRDDAQNKMRLMMVAPSMEMGALGRLAVNLLSQMNRTLIQSELALVFDKERFYAVPDEITVHFVEKHHSPKKVSPSLVLPRHLCEYTDNLAWLEVTAFKLADLINKREPSVIVALDSFTSIILLLAKRYIPQTVTLIVRHHLNLRLMQKSPLGSLHIFLMRELYNSSHYAIAHSTGMAHELRHFLGVRPEKIIFRYNPFNFAQAQEMANEEITEHSWFAEDIPVALFVGRLEPEKGLGYLLRALSIVKQSTELRCVLIGEGKERNKLEQLAEELGLEKDVLFMGEQHNPFKFMKKATLFALPSLSESFGNVLVEALACGCPIIATDCREDGPFEILNGGEYGLLVPSEDEQALAGAIIRLLDDANLRRKFSTSGPSRAQAFASGSLIKDYEELFLKDHSNDLQFRCAERELFSKCRSLLDIKWQTGDMEAALHDKDRELTKLQKTLTQIYGSITWRLLRKYEIFLNRFLPAGTRRRHLYNQIVSAVGMLAKGDWGSLWLSVKQGLSQSVRYARISEIGSKELKDSRRRLMGVIPTMGVAGGAERCMAVLMEHLTGELIRPELVEVFDRIPFYPVPEHIPVHVLERFHHFAAIKHEFLLPHHLKSFINNYAWLEMTAGKLAEVIKKRRPSVILAQDYFASIIALLAKKHIPRSMKVIASAHCDPSGLLSVMKSGDLYAFLIQKLFNTADCVVAISESIAQDLETLFGIQPGKIVIAYNPLDIARMQEMAVEEVTEHQWFSEAVPIVLFVGRLAPQKGLNYLFRAINMIRKSSEVRCVLIGEGEEQKNLQKVAERLNIAEDILFMGKHQNPYKFMRRAKIFILPSLFEGVPYVLLEALACGCPVIATDCKGGGSAEILENGRYGLLVPPGDEKALSEGILGLLRDNEKCEKFSSLGLQRVQAFDLKSSLKTYEDIILGDFGLRGVGLE